MVLITYPIAEQFHSVQGEGLYAGTPMHFIRLAGCCVGKPPADPEVVAFVNRSIAVPQLKTGQPAWLCRTYDGRPFWCDTDFHKYTERTVEQLVEATHEKHVCLTGGEPLMHRVDPIIQAFMAKNVMVHIETSGTINMPVMYPSTTVWITVAPKHGVKEEMLEIADEIKLLVDDQFNEVEALQLTQHATGMVFIQPVNHETRVSYPNLQRCLEILQRQPQWRLSVQLHKYLDVR